MRPTPRCILPGQARDHSALTASGPGKISRESEVLSAIVEHQPFNYHRHVTFSRPELLQTAVPEPLEAGVSACLPRPRLLLPTNTMFLYHLTDAISSRRRRALHPPRSHPEIHRSPSDSSERNGKGEAEGGCGGERAIG